MQSFFNGLGIRTRIFAAAGVLLAAPALLANDQGKLGNLVVAGDSLSAGYQDNQLIDCIQPGGNYCFSKPNGQRFGYANVIATQAGVNLNLPLIPPPGFPQIIFEGGYANAVNYTPIPRESNTQTLDVSVPGYTIEAMVGYNPLCPPDPSNTQVPYPIQVMALEILNPTDFNAVFSGNGCPTTTPTELAEAAGLAAQLNPETSILWIGSNDALFPLLFYGQKPTDPFTFAYLYNIAISTMHQTSKQLIVANIPDVTLTPYLTSVPTLAAELTAEGIPMTTQQAEAVFGLAAGDKLTPYAFAVIDQMAQAQQFGTLPPFITVSNTDVPVVIRAAEIQQLRTTIFEYNAAIAIEAALHHATLVDIYSLVNDLAAHGVVADGQKLTTAFKGGLFSLDGVHPSNTGYAIIANKFIQTMNARLGTHIPLANIDAVAANDPFVFGSSTQGHYKDHVSSHMADALRGIFHRH